MTAAETLSPAAAAPRSPRDWSRAVRIVGYTTVFLALATATATFFVLMGLTPIPPTQDVVFWALIVNGVLVAILVGAVGWEITRLLLARRRGLAAARLHVRIVALFSIVAVAPAILVAIVASVTLDRGLDHWFSTRTQAIVETSVQVADAYLQEHARSIGGDLLTMKTEIERASTLFREDPFRFQSFLTNIAQFHGLPGVFLVRRDGTVAGEAFAGSSQAYPPAPLEAIGDQALASNIPALIAPGSTNLVGGVLRLEGFGSDGMYLYAIREIDPQVIQYLQMTQDNAAEYRNLEATRTGVQIAFGLLYLGISLVVLLSAIWLGIGVANRLVSPIRGLIGAADRVASGNLNVEVPVSRSDGDIGALGLSFNKMTAQLRTQRQELVNASDHIDSRRRFIEAVLSGVTAGVVGIDGDGNTTVVNRSALRLLGIGQDTAFNRTITELVPELAEVIEAARTDGRPEHRAQITLSRNNRERTINVRVTTEGSSDGSGYVITLDDITDLVTAQRSSAWADVARRIAHEIKNPLTPIQLSAERLKRKFGKAIVEDRQIFDQCTDTIIRQVGDIGRMVDEFSSFARMPKPALEVGDLREPIREAAFMMQVGNPDIDLSVALADEPLVGRFDQRLMSQAVTNLIKNATEAIAALPPEKAGKGRIAVTARDGDGQIVVEITDNGIGLPAENRHRLLEPYMTTREKGTGLGLAIVRKIVEEHSGRIDLLDAPAVADGGHGAMVRLTFPRIAPASEPEPAAPEAAAV